MIVITLSIKGFVTNTVCVFGEDTCIFGKKGKNTIFLK